MEQDEAAGEWGPRVSVQGSQAPGDECHEQEDCKWQGGALKEKGRRP